MGVKPSSLVCKAYALPHPGSKRPVLTLGVPFNPQNKKPDFRFVINLLVTFGRATPQPLLTKNNPTSLAYLCCSAQDAVNQSLGNGRARVLCKTPVPVKGHNRCWTNL